MSINSQREAASAARKIHAAEKAVKDLAPLKEELGAYVWIHGLPNKTGKSREMGTGEFITAVRPKTASVSYAKAWAALKATHPDLTAEMDELLKQFTSQPDGLTVSIK